MDSLDRRILREVQRDCLLSAAELAQRCATTESTALRRLKRLRRDGVVRAEVAIVDGGKAGRPLLLHVGVRLEREDGPAVRDFIARVREHPAVLHFHFVTGSADYLILLSVGSMAEYDAFLQDCLVNDPIVVMSDTNVVIRAIKMETALPIADVPGQDAR